MKKTWEINEFSFNDREAAKKYLIKLCADDPCEYYHNADLWSSFEEWLWKMHRKSFYDWWLDFTRGNASNIIDAVSLFRMFLPRYWGKTAEDVVDDFMYEGE